MPATKRGRRRKASGVRGLRYVTDALPGIRRLRAGRGFRYLMPNGSPLRAPIVLRRIRSLAIPPAWTNVWICPLENGHIQAIGRDSRGRRQYLYHPRWREVRDENKYDRALMFAEALPAIRRTVEEHLSLPGLPRRKVLATVVRLLETTLVRVGNRKYARQNGSFGLTTLRSRHVGLEGSTVRFSFTGKGKKTHEVCISDQRVARVIQRCLDLPGYELFQYIGEDGSRASIDASEVNEYLKGITDAEFTAKDFRTWAGTVLATDRLLAAGAAGSETELKKNITLAVEEVALELRNTPAICRKCYVHPVIFEAYSSGKLFTAAAKPVPKSGPSSRLESIVLNLLRDSTVARAA